VCINSLPPQRKIGGKFLGETLIDSRSLRRSRPDKDLGREISKRVTGILPTSLLKPIKGGGRKLLRF
jgi:hypothetical protein